MVLQPALQLASRVLESNHPCWETLLDLYTRRPVPDSQDSRNPEAMDLDEVPHRNSIWPGQYDRNQMHKPNLKLLQLGFNWKAATMDLLRDRLRFDIGSALHEHALGWTIFHRGKKPNFAIHIYISAELIWPLLSSAFSLAEKANISANLASTFLHELAVRHNSVLHACLAEASLTLGAAACRSLLPPHDHGKSGKLAEVQA